MQLVKWIGIVLLSAAIGLGAWQLIVLHQETTNLHNEVGALRQEVASSSGLTNFGLTQANGALGTLQARLSAYEVCMESGSSNAITDATSCYKPVSP